MPTTTAAVVRHCLFFILVVFLSPLSATSHDLVRTSCSHASYPDLCVKTLSSYGGGASNQRELAQAAVRVSLSHVRKASEFLSQVKGTVGGSREQGALADCVEEMGDSVENLSKTLSALQHLRRGGDFQWQMSNVETWVSAALTYEDTCLDGFKEINGKVRSDVRRRITNVARVTSNALYLINLLDDSKH